MLRLGIVDCDTSHVFEFARRLNHVDIESAQWVAGARVEAAIAGSSRITDRSKIDEYVSKLCATGVDLVDTSEELIDRVDAVLITSNDGSVHLERASPFIRAGLPIFINKPLATTLIDATRLMELAHEAGVTVFSASALRFASDLKKVGSNSSLGPLIGVDVYAPAKLNRINPGLFHYGVHGVEMLYSLMGKGCCEVSCLSEEHGEVVMGRWQDGRLGCLRGLRFGATGYGLTAFGENEIHHCAIDTTFIYRDILSVIVPALANSRSPITAAEQLEIVAFQEAALASARAGGKPLSLGTPSLFGG